MVYINKNALLGNLFINSRDVKKPIVFGDGFWYDKGFWLVDG